VRAAGDIGLFKIVSEGGIASGVRRIEAVTGDGALAWVEADEERLLRLERIAAEEGKTISEVVRHLLDIGYEDWIKERRHRAVEELCAMEIEEMPEPEELSRQLASTYDVDLP
jgi:alanyl-tRNA synthetase